jgi:hypothetical protein
MIRSKRKAPCFALIQQAAMVVVIAVIDARNNNMNSLAYRK